MKLKLFRISIFYVFYIHILGEGGDLGKSFLGPEKKTTTFF
jgi:hypothetical protein